jgi:DNA-binding CsgD family transcriptional regulator
VALYVLKAAGRRLKLVRGEKHQGAQQAGLPVEEILLRFRHGSFRTQKIVGDFRSAFRAKHREPWDTPCSVASSACVCRGQLELVAKRGEPELAAVAEGNSLLALSLDLERRPAAILGLDGRVAVANSAMIVALHRSRQDFRGLRGDALFSPECRADVRRNLEVGRPGHELVFETTCEAANGLFVPVTMRLVTTAADATGRSAHVFTIVAFRGTDSAPVLATGVAYVVSADVSSFGKVLKAWGPALRGKPSPIGRPCCEAFCGDAECRRCPVFAKGLGPEGVTKVVSKQVAGKTVLEVVSARTINNSEIAVTRWPVDSALMSALVAARVSAICASAKLSDREAEILGLLLLGRSVGDIAKELHIVVRTAKYHQRSVLSKVGAESRFDLCRLLL